MAFDAYFADRIRRLLSEKNIYFTEKRMFGGICFLLDDKMLCGISYNKKKQMDLLMARIGPKEYESSLKKDGCHPMDFTGRPMKGYVFISPEGYDKEEDLSYWLQLCIDYNPLAKSSKKKK